MKKKIIILTLSILTAFAFFIVAPKNRVSASDSRFNQGGGINSVVVKLDTGYKGTYNNYTIRVYYTSTAVSYIDLINYCIDVSTEINWFVNTLTKNYYVAKLYQGNTSDALLDIRLNLHSNYHDLITLQPNIQFYADSSYEYYKQGYNDGEANGIEEGKAQGIEEGKQQGIEEGRQQGIEEGKQIGYNDGYSKGYQEASQDLGDSALNFNSTILNVLSYPVTLIRSFLDFDIFGINLFAVISSIISLSLAFWLIKKFI